MIAGPALVIFGCMGTVALAFAIARLVAAVIVGLRRVASWRRSRCNAPHPSRWRAQRCTLRPRHDGLHHTDRGLLREWAS